MDSRKGIKADPSSTAYKSLSGSIGDAAFSSDGDKAEIQKTKKFLLDQIAQIKKKSNDKIQLNVDVENKSNQKQKVNKEKEIEMETIEII